MKIIAISALAAAMAVSASADSYVSTFGGVNVADSFGTTIGPVIINSDTNTGYVIGLAVGTEVKSIPGLRFEGELAYRNNDLDLGITVGAPPPVFVVPGVDSTWSLMGNLAYDIPVGDFPLKPYLLGGAGYAERHITLHPFGLDLGTSEGGFAYQLGAGVNYGIADGVSIGVGYRYFHGPDVERGFGPISVDASGANHSVTAGLTFKL